MMKKKRSKSKNNDDKSLAVSFGGCWDCIQQLGVIFKVIVRSRVFPVHGRSMLNTLHGDAGLCGNDIVLGVGPSRHLPLWPREGDVVFLVDSVGCMVKRLIWIAAEEGAPERAWCWVEGDNARLSEDSRYFGWIESHRFDAVAIAVIWPPWRFQFLLELSRFR
eukprot:6094733-Amphidinium_carterae.1